jgi:nucleoside-diphosphate-sugar epimerase
MIFVTGATGGLGHHVGPVLAETRADHAALMTRLEDSEDLPGELSRVTQHPGGVLSLIHLAGLTSVAECQANPAHARQVNVLATAAYIRKFVEWSLDRGTAPSIVYVSTGHVYGVPKRGEQVTEANRVAPRSVYAQTKADAEQVLHEICASLAVPLVIARVFGVVGPDQPNHYILPALIDRVTSRQIVDIPGLDYVRDYLDARDVAAHVVSLALLSNDLERPDSMVVNVCSGVGVAIRDLFNEIVVAIHGDGSVAAEDILANVSGAPGRPTDNEWLVGSPTRLIQETGRPPRSIDLATTVRDALS